MVSLFPPMCIFIALCFSFFGTGFGLLEVTVGFVAPIDQSLGPLATFGNELSSAFRIAVEEANKESREVQLSTDFTNIIKDESSGSEDRCKLLGSELNSTPNIVGFVGALKSSCSVAIQSKLKDLESNLTEISYASTAVELTSPENFPRFFRTTTDDRAQAEALVSLFAHYKWKRAGIVLYDSSYYDQGLRDEFIAKLRRANILLVDQVVLNAKMTDLEIDDKLIQLKTSGSKINVLFAQGEAVFRIFKRIKAKNMFGDGWIWLGTADVSSLWFGADQDVNRTAEGLVSVAPAMLTDPSYIQVVNLWYVRDPVLYPGKIWMSVKEPNIGAYVLQVLKAVTAYYQALLALVREGRIGSTTTIDVIQNEVYYKLLAINSRETQVKSAQDVSVFFKPASHDVEAEYYFLNQRLGEFHRVGTWSGAAGLSMSIGTGVIWPGGSTLTPTDQGRPGKPVFRIGFLAPINKAFGMLSEFGAELVSAFRVAVDLINNDKSSQVELDSVIADEGDYGESLCERSANQLAGSSIVGLVGGYHSLCSMNAHKVLATDQIPMISYASSGVELSDKSRFKYFFRAVPSSDHESEALKQILRTYNSFEQVSTIYSDETSSSQIALKFEALVRNSSVPVVTSRVFPSYSKVDGLREKLEQLRFSGSHVSLLSSLPNDASVAFQIIKELRMTGKGWIWLGSSGTSSLPFKRDLDVGQALSGMLAVGPKSGEGALYLKFLSAWMEKSELEYPGVVHDLNVKRRSSLAYTAQVFDAVNAFALSLSDLVSRGVLSHKTGLKDIRQKLYSRLKAFDSAANGVPSVTGAPLYFDAQQNAPVIYDVVNLQNGVWKKVGQFKTKLEFFENPIFPGGTVIPFVSTNKVVYKVVALVPLHTQLGELAELGSIWKFALMAAVNWVNKNDSLGVGFDLTVIDSGVQAWNCSQAGKEIPMNTDIVIGPARSHCTVEVYAALADRGIPIFAYSSTSSVLSKKSLYPNLFRVCPSDTYQAQAIAELIERYAWDKVGIIGSSGIYGHELAADIEKELQPRAVKVTARELYKDTESLSQHMEKLKSSGSAVNIVIGNPSEAGRVYQEAFEMGIVGKGWTWIGSDGAVSTNFVRSPNLQRAMQGMVGFRPEGGKGFLFEQLFLELKKLFPGALKQTAYLAQVFDTVLAPATALHKLHDEEKVGPTTPRVGVRTLLLDKLRTMTDVRNSYESATGKLAFFDLHQDALPSYDLVNLNGDSWVTVGHMRDSNLEITSSVIWSGGTIKTPPSNPPKQEESGDSDGGNGATKGLIALAVIFSVFGILVVLFMVYIIRRVRHRHLYMQSDLNQGGVFSVLYGHTVSRHHSSNGRLMSETSNGQAKLASAAYSQEELRPRLSCAAYSHEYIGPVENVPSKRRSRAERVESAECANDMLDERDSLVDKHCSGDSLESADSGAVVPRNCAQLRPSQASDVRTFETSVEMSTIDSGQFSVNSHLV